MLLSPIRFVYVAFQELQSDLDVLVPFKVECYVEYQFERNLAEIQCIVPFQMASA